MNSVDTNQNNIEEKKQKTKLKKSILVLIIVIIMGLIGVTIANQVEKKSKASVTTGNYNVIINGNTTVSPSGLIPINNTSDTISSDNLSNYSDSIFVSEFTVKGADGNPTDQDIIYDIALIDSNIDTNLLNSYLKWELIKNNEVISNGNFFDLTNGERYVLTNIQQDLPANNETADSLKLVIWINNDFPEEFDQTTMMNKSFNATIDVELYTKSKIGQTHSPDSLYYNITQTAVMDNIKSKYVTSNTGIKFNKISSDTNGKGIYIMSGTENDRNPIYYFRGNVDNNNVLFANFCWKIVRTTDTGGIKMIYNGPPSNGTCNNTGDSTQIGTSKFNATAISLTYGGYMYGTPYNDMYRSMVNDASSYVYGNDVTYNNGQYTLINTISGTHSSLYNGGLNNHHYTCFTTSNSCTDVYYIYFTEANRAYFISLSNGKKIEDAISEMLDYNVTDSTIKVVVDNWYSNNMTSYTDDYIEDTVYCNDRSIYQFNGWNPNGGNTTKILYFASFARASNPITTCPRDNDKFTISINNGNGNLQYPVGLLTEDEARIAGSATGFVNNSYYLYNNKNWWLLSAFHTNSLNSYEWTIDNGGQLNAYDTNYSHGVRPVISLKPNIKLSTGDGTANNPYTVSK